MDTRTPYETLIGKSREMVIRELEQLIGAAQITLTEGSQWLVNQRAPNGPIMRERSVSHVYKCPWALHAAGVDACYIAEMLDWLYENALQPNGDFFFPEESADHSIGTRSYRQIVFMKFAALLNHRMMNDEKVMQRLHQYLNPVSGGVFYYIGEDPDRPEYPDYLSVGEAGFFGELMIAAGLKHEAIEVGNWMLKMVQANGEHMAEEGVFYCTTDREGRLITDVGAGNRFNKTVNNWDANQQGWNLGCAMALLSDLYDVMRSEWGYDAEAAEPYLDAALSLLDFENTMPLYTYFYLSKCKVAWGVGQLLSALLKYGLGTEEQLDRLYRTGKRVFIYTFLGSQLPDGSWPAMHFPFGDDSPELQHDYRVLKGLTLNPADETESSGVTSSYLPAVEITGEFLGEIGALAKGMKLLLQRYQSAAD